MQRKKYCTWQLSGRTTSGAIAVTSALTPRIGDKILAVLDSTAHSDVTAQFEASVTVAGQVQQTGTSGISAADSCQALIRRRGT